MKTIQVKKLSDRARLPIRNVPTDGGLDIYSAEDVFIPVGETVKIATDIAVNIEPGYVGIVCDRSSMGSRGLRTGAGVIDAGYTGHLCIVLHNLNNTTGRADTDIANRFASLGSVSGYQVNAGDKIAQLVVHSVSLPIVEEVKEFPDTERGTRSFGSSGR